MKLVRADKTMGESFGKNYLPKIYINILLEELKKPEYIQMFTIIKEKFNISKDDFKKYIKFENTIVSKINDQYIINFRDIIIKQSVSLVQIINFINDGNLNVKGYNLFNNVASYINTNIENIYMYYLMRGD